MTPVTKPILILVPGICHDASYFDDTKGRLQAFGYEVHCRTNPSLNDCTKSWSDDRDALLKIMEAGLDNGDEFFLLTHSYGSAPAIAACQGQSVSDRKATGKTGGIRGVVIVASGVVTVSGDSVVGKFGGHWPPYCLPDPEKQDGLAHPTESAKKAFYSDLDEDTAEKLGYKLKPQSVASVTDPISCVPRDITVPLFYLQCTDDLAFPLQYQQMICKEIPGIKIASIKSDHSPYLSKPEEFVQQLVAWIERS